jgi:hypothetical protein
VVMGEEVGRREPAAGVDQRVPEPGTVLAGIATVVTAAGRRARHPGRTALVVEQRLVGTGTAPAAGAGRGGDRGGQRTQRGQDLLGVLDGAVATDLHAAEVVGGEREVAGVVRAALVLGPGAIERDGAARRVDLADHVGERRAQVARVVAPAAHQAEQAAGDGRPERGVVGQGGDLGGHGAGLCERDLAGAEGGPDLGQLAHLRRRADQPTAAALVPAEGVGEEVLGRGPALCLDGMGLLEPGGHLEQRGVEQGLGPGDLGRDEHRLVGGEPRVVEPGQRARRRGHGGGLVERGGGGHARSLFEQVFERQGWIAPRDERRGT